MFTPTNPWHPTIAISKTVFLLKKLESKKMRIAAQKEKFHRLLVLPNIFSISRRILKKRCRWHVRPFQQNRLRDGIYWRQIVPMRNENKKVEKKRTVWLPISAKERFSITLRQDIVLYELNFLFCQGRLLNVMYIKMDINRFQHVLFCLF